jgi:hypothetical protein
LPFVFFFLIMRVVPDSVLGKGLEWAKPKG